MSEPNFMKNDPNYEQRVAALNEVDRITREYVEGFEMEGETEDGADAICIPTDHERMLIEQAFFGLHASNEFVAAWDKWRSLC